MRTLIPNISVCESIVLTLLSLPCMSSLLECGIMIESKYCIAVMVLHGKAFRLDMTVVSDVERFGQDEQEREPLLPAILIKLVCESMTREDN